MSGTFRLPNDRTSKRPINTTVTADASRVDGRVALITQVTSLYGREVVDRWQQRMAVPPRRWWARWRR